MGLFSKRKSESPTVDEILQMKDRELQAIIREGKVPQKSPRELRKAAQVAKRATEGDKGLAALAAGMKGGGTGNRNYNNVPLRDRVHPAEYQRILEREAKKQGLL
jgi:hypothetical protein